MAVTVASSSSSTSLSEKKYDVFISFRGVDTRNNFLSHLRDALHRAKIKSFIDDDLRRGDNVPKALLRSIEESKISVVIFSKRYAHSRWCLDELVQIMECNKKNTQIVIPIFFNVDPTHVRHQSETFAQGLAKHGDHPNIQRWRDVLTKAANLSGWDSHVIRPEATLIKNIVSDILGKLYYTSSSTFGSLVGMRSRLMQIDHILRTIHEEIRIIGFWGMGGIGKSTLARAFFNHVFSQFQGHYMIQNFRETCEKCGLNELLDRLVSGLLKDENLNVGTPNLEISFIRDRLSHTNVLIVLDDVNDFKHIELLVGRRDCLGPGSTVVITSRDKQVLRNGVDKIYEVRGLDDHEAFCLFSQHAFKLEYPKYDHQMKLAERAINYAKGNPLALKVLGSCMLGRSNEEQESALSKLEKIPNMDIQKVLRISYDGLDNEEKNIFLNIACFFKGETIDKVKCFHNNCGYSIDIGIRDLMDKSLITPINAGMVTPTNAGMIRVHMHDLLQEMGREIVREECTEEPGKRSRLWDYCDISHVLTKNTGTEAIKGISLIMDCRRSFSINPMAFERMHNLEFLEIKDNNLLLLPQGLGYLPDQLRYLEWSGYPLTQLPSNFHIENLVNLIMPFSKIIRLWNGRQSLPHLQLIILTCSQNLIEIPDLSMAPNLSKLGLFGCSQIKKFPKVSTKIEYLDLCCTTIEEVPSSIDCLTSVIRMNLMGCERLKNLPDDICKLKSLQFLDISLPPKEESEHLEEVNIHPRGLTDSLGSLSALKHLDISGNHFLKIPDSIKQLTNLEYLNIDNCKMLQSLPQLPMNVQCICARNCVSMEVVASPLTTSTKGEFKCLTRHDSIVEQRIAFDFANCFKLNQNAINSIVADAELKLLQWEVNRSERFSKRTIEAEINFLGGDIPDWFKYKSLGSSLTAKLPKHWCNSNLFCLGVGIVLDFKDFDGSDILNYDCHIKNNIGGCSSGKGWFDLIERETKDAFQSNHVLLSYGQSCMINEWRMITKETNDAAVISIEFHVQGFHENHCKVKMCGIHLLYRHETKDRCHTSRIDSDSPSGSNQFFLNPGFIEEDMEETRIGDAKGDGGYDDNCCNMDNLVEFSTPMRRKKMKK